MYGNLRVALMLLAICTPLTHAADKSDVHKQSTCNAYAAKSADQYKKALYFGCKLEANLMWQPSRDINFATCMQGSTTDFLALLTKRDLAVNACAEAATKRSAVQTQTQTQPQNPMSTQTPAPAPVALAFPRELKLCENTPLRFCGTWTLSGSQYIASWTNGSKATVSVTKYDGHVVVFHRIDTSDSVSAGLIGDYNGVVEAGKMKGTVTFQWPEHTPSAGSGIWEATFVP